MSTLGIALAGLVVIVSSPVDFFGIWQPAGCWGCLVCLEKPLTSNHLVTRAASTMMNSSLYGASWIDGALADGFFLAFTTLRAIFISPLDTFVQNPSVLKTRLRCQSHSAISTGVLLVVRREGGFVRYRIRSMPAFALGGALIGWVVSVVLALAARGETLFGGKIGYRHEFPPRRISFFLGVAAGRNSSQSPFSRTRQFCHGLLGDAPPARFTYSLIFALAGSVSAVVFRAIAQKHPDGSVVSKHDNPS
jgi:hypothetical protein